MINNELALWVDDVIGSCLVERRDGRYRDAAHICETIQRSVESGLAPGGIGCWSKRTVMVRPDTVGKIRSSIQNQIVPRASTAPDEQRRQAPAMESLEVDPPKPKKGVNLVVLLGSLSFVVGVVITAVLYFLFAHSDPVPANVNQEWSSLLASAPPDLQKLGNDFIAKDASLTKRGDAIKRIGQNNHQKAFDIVLEAFRSTQEPSLRIAAGDALLERIKASGYERSVQVLSSWFRMDQQNMQSPADRPGFELLINSCNPNLPVDQRRVDLSRGYTQQPVLALQLAAALALDVDDTEGFAPVLQQLLAVELNRDDLRTKSAAALIVTHKPLAMLFNEGLNDLIKQMTAAELSWSMFELAKRNSLLVFQLAQETLDRQIVPPYQSVFLEALVSSAKAGIPNNVRLALIGGASNQLSERDIGALGRWYSQSAEKPLLAICAISDSPELALLAFDTLAAKSVYREPARSLITWIKNTKWAERKKLVKAVGILGLAEIASTEEIGFAFDQLMPHAGVSLLDYIMNSRNTDLLRVAIDRFAELASNERLLSLLRHKDPDIRASAVRGLQGRNNLHVLQSVLREYQREEDPRVRKLYRKYHFVVRDREDRR
jgi:hypothetical protein